MSRDQLGFSTAPKMSRIMEANGHYAAIMRADKKKEDNAGLPSGVPIPCLPVDYLKERPSFWIGGSYVCPVSPDWGLWFNWQMNRRDMSILTSVKGMNPITGQRISGLGLEQYKEQCPVHKIPLKHGKFCSECNFKWPDQNYITDPTPFYLDGFRSEDGVVRQFYFTEDMAKSVPELVIGRDDTVPAFGFCFYQLKNNPRKFESSSRLRDKIPDDWIDRPVISGSYLKTTSWMGTARTGRKADGEVFTTSPSPWLSRTGSWDMLSDSVRVYRGSSGGSSDDLERSSDSPAVYACCAASMTPSFDMNSVRTMGMSVGESLSLSEGPQEVRGEVGVGAGVKIAQKMNRDEHSLDEWQDKPAGVIRVYFVFQEEFERYVEAGLNDLNGLKEGYLNGVPVGVDHE